MRGSPKTTAGRRSEFFARSVSGGKINTVTPGATSGTPPSVATEIEQAPARKATPAQTVASGQFGAPSGKSGSSPGSLLSGQLKGAGAASGLNGGYYGTGAPRGPYGKVRVR